jgi:hypothetical protein
MIAVGPSATLLCKAWCDRVYTAVSDCHHDQVSTAAALTGTADCESAGLSAVLPEDIRRGVSSPDSGTAVLVLRNHFTASTSQPDVRDASALRSPPALRPLLTALRI